MGFKVFIWFLEASIPVMLTGGCGRYEWRIARYVVGVSSSFGVSGVWIRLYGGDRMRTDEQRLAFKTGGVDEDGETKLYAGVGSVHMEAGGRIRIQRWWPISTKGEAGVVRQRMDTVEQRGREWG
jgi:hypothetical protein